MQSKSCKITFASDYDIDIVFNISNLIFTFNLTVRSGRTKFTTIIITHSKKNNQIIEEKNFLVVTLKAPNLPTTEFVNIQINNIRGIII